MALVTEILLVSGVALDLVGAGVLSHAHNAESIVELREDIGEEGTAVGEPDAISTHAQLLAEKRIGFFLLTVGLILYLSGLVSKSPEDLAIIGLIAGGVVWPASWSASSSSGWWATESAARRARRRAGRPTRCPSSSVRQRGVGAGSLGAALGRSAWALGSVSGRWPTAPTRAGPKARQWAARRVRRWAPTRPPECPRALRPESDPPTPGLGRVGRRRAKSSVRRSSDPSCWTWEIVVPRPPDRACPAIASYMVSTPPARTKMATAPSTALSTTDRRRLGSASVASASGVTAGTSVGTGLEVERSSSSDVWLRRPPSTPRTAALVWRRDAV